MRISIPGKIFLAACILLAASCKGGSGGGSITLTVLSTSDVHGAWFDSTYTKGRTHRSLVNIKPLVDSIKAEKGSRSVVLLDGGDCLQGDNSTFYYNYIDTVSPHLLPRILSYMGYDAVAIGNHDIETGHPVFDRVRRQMDSEGIPLLGANAISSGTGKPYFQEYAIIKRGGVKVAVIGFTNPNIREWIPRDLWDGMTFEPLIPLAQEVVDRVRRKENPDAVIILSHSGAGEKDGHDIENQGMDMLETIRGVDLFICAHDHKPLVVNRDSTSLVDSGSGCRYLGESTITISKKGRKVTSRSVSSHLIPIDTAKVDRQMKEHFREEYAAVRKFTSGKIGSADSDLHTSDSYKGMSLYMNLLHTVCLGCYPAEVSIAAPLSYDEHIDAGDITINDIFSIYPYENRVFVIRLTGSELKKYLELSYDNWIQPLDENGHVLKIVNKDNVWTGKKGWSFANRYYVFDSVGGLNYSVDIFKPFGQRIEIKSMADGRPFRSGRFYNVAITSFRLCGGGDLLTDGAGLSPEEASDRIVARYPEVRELMYNFIQQNGRLSPEQVSDSTIIGHWEFAPKGVTKMIDNDFALLFGR